MTGHRIGLDLFSDVLDVPRRHGFAGGDDLHAGRASSSSATWPASTTAPGTTPTGPRPPSRPSRLPADRQSPGTTWTPTR